MTATTDFDARTANEQVVPRPRITDALGSSLRTIFGNDAALSPDMLRMLQRLDGLKVQ